MRIVLAAMVFGTLTVWAQELPKGFVIAEESESPDGRYGVIVPVREKVEEAKAGRRIAWWRSRRGGYGRRSKGRPSWDYTNHESILPAKWASDGSLMLWEVEGKWFPHA